MDASERSKLFQPLKGQLFTDLEKKVGAPWPEAFIAEMDNGEWHFAPTTEHVHEVDCWCEPLLDTANENYWIHRNIPYCTHCATPILAGPSIKEGPYA